MSSTRRSKSPPSPAPSSYAADVADLSAEALERKFDRITGGVQRLKERFFDGGRIGKPSPSPEADDKNTTYNGPRRHANNYKSTQCVYEVVDGRKVPVKLKKPIAQIGISSEERDYSNQPTARWPDCIELGDNIPKHIYYSPNFREPFYEGPKLSPNNAHQSVLRKLTTAPKLVGFGGSSTSHQDSGVSTSQKPVPVSRLVYQRNEETFGGRSSRFFLSGHTKTYPKKEPKPVKVKESTLYSDDDDWEDSDEEDEDDDDDDESMQHLEPWYCLESHDDDTLIFESRFESGNLNEARRNGKTNEYDLLLQTDLYTNKHTQWFYFSIRNVQKGRKYTFRINNFLKGDSLYNHGMQPVIYSRVRAERDQVGWLREGEGMHYYRNNNRVPYLKGERFYYTLAFTYTCQDENDCIYIAHCYPYTYTDLQTYLTDIRKDPYKSKICRQRVLCHSLAGNVCDMLTITQFGVPPEVMRLRRGVVVTSRVHPGESNASWMMKGFLDFILSDDPDAIILRRHFVFKVVPMLNPDGVIVGNYRTSLSGVDLNRIYKSPIRELYPTIFNLKLAMKRIRQDRPIVLYCDLHGHSRKQNVFVYGCNNDARPNLLLKERIFPKMMSLNAPGHFNFDGCRFAVKKAKESTGRVNTWKEIGMINCFTMESTFCGSTIGPLKGMQFNCKDFEHLGYALCDTLLDYCDPNPSKKTRILEALRTDKEHHDRERPENSDSSGVDSDDSPGSDSSESDGMTAVVEMQFRKRILKKTRTTPPAAPTKQVEEELKKPKAKLKSKAHRDRLRKIAAAQSKVKSGKAADVDQNLNKGPKKAEGKRTKFKSRYDERSRTGIPSFSAEQAALRRSSNGNLGAQVKSQTTSSKYIMDSSPHVNKVQDEPPEPPRATTVGKSIIARYLQVMEQQNQDKSSADSRGSEPGTESETGTEQCMPQHSYARANTPSPRTVPVIPSQITMDFAPNTQAIRVGSVGHASSSRPRQSLVDATLELLKKKVTKERKKVQKAYKHSTSVEQDWLTYKADFLRSEYANQDNSVNAPVTGPIVENDKSMSQTWSFHRLTAGKEEPEIGLLKRPESPLRQKWDPQKDNELPARPRSHSGLHEHGLGPGKEFLRRPSSGETYVPRRSNQFVFGPAPLSPIPPSPEILGSPAVDGGVNRYTGAPRASAASPAGGSVNAVRHLRQQTSNHKE